MKNVFVSMLLMACTFSSLGQFHTMKIPKISNEVTETQTLGVTDITINYHSPSTYGRDVWNDNRVIPQNGDPIAWRAGANMNTTIQFSTDVLINDNPLPKGTYGFHVIPREGTYDLLFAHHAQQWGSYYLDLDKDISLTVTVNAEPCPHSEKLDFEFLDWSDSEVKIGLEWANQRLPFTVSVDLNKTVVESFRSELRGINTYHWQAWNDAALWCLNHETNLDEALEWANRSIEGGYNGFAANKNLTNLSTKISLLDNLARKEELETTLNEAMDLATTPMELNSLSILMMRVKQSQAAVQLLNKKIDQYPDAWFLKLNLAIAHYFGGNSKKSLSILDSLEVPNNFLPRFEQIKKEIKEGNYQLPG